jgi:hypothetical protein
MERERSRDKATDKGGDAQEWTKANGKREEQGQGNR